MARLYAAMIVARMSIGIDGIASVLFLRHEGKSFALAGATAGALALGSALGAPFNARLIDRLTPRVLAWLAAGHAAGLIADELGVTTTVILRSAAQIRKLAASKPPYDETTYVAFTARKPSRSRHLEGVFVADDYVFPRSARLSAAQIERALGVPATVRNWNTVEKLAQRIQA